MSEDGSDYNCAGCGAKESVYRAGDNKWRCFECDNTFGNDVEPNFIIRAEPALKTGVKQVVVEAILEQVPGIVEATLLSTRDDRMEIDRLVDQVEDTYDVEVNAKYRNRLAIGQSKNVALLNAKQDQGQDLTPDAYLIPWHEKTIEEIDAASGKKIMRVHKYQGSHFTMIPGFRDAFRLRVEDLDADHVRAYEETCVEFKVSPGDKNFGRYTKALSEMPKTARGGYLKGRAEAEQLAQRQRLLDEGRIEGGRLLREARGGSLTDAGSDGRLGDEMTDVELDKVLEQNK